MAVFEVDPLRDGRWKHFVDNHPRSSVFHTWEWLQALNRTYGYEPLALSSCSPDFGLTDAVVFCRIRSVLTGNRFVSLPFSDHCEPLTGSLCGTECLIAPLREAVDRAQWRYIEMRTAAASPEMPKFLNLKTTYFLHRVNLKPSQEELFNGFHKDCVQRKIKRAMREGLRYEEGRSEMHLREFYRLMVMTRRRQSLPPQPFEWFRALAASFGKNLKIRFAYKEAVAVASILTLSHRKTVTYKYACSDARFHNLGGIPFILWNTIRESKMDGLEELDMGRSNADHAGLIAFKERWGANRSLLTYWRYPAAPQRTRFRWSKRIMRNIVPVIPDKPLVIAGSLLYRHVG